MLRAASAWGAAERHVARAIATARRVLIRVDKRRPLVGEQRARIAAYAPGAAISGDRSQSEQTFDRLHI
jgi:hypothetical protein